MAQTIKKFSLVRITLKYLGLFLLSSFILIVVTSPYPGDLQDQTPTQTAFMRHSLNGKKSLIQPKPIKPVSLQNISPQLIKAVLSSEDDLFFKHNGFNTTEIFKALITNIKKGRISRGGSTLTQQLARNLYLSPKKSIVRKVREAYITFLLELNLSKSRILELYLNTAQFGPGIYGAEQAARYHFGQSAKSLSAHQAALLAAMLPRPSVYGKKPYPSRTYLRQKRILRRMHKYALYLPKKIKVKQNATVQKTNKSDSAPIDEKVTTEIEFIEGKKSSQSGDDFNEF